MKEPPRISVLTPSYNQGKFIEQNIRSVLAQGYSNVEHIVVDGGSSDETVPILQQHQHLKWVSERDGGQADALNKGLRMATGELVGWVNSDDFYATNVFRRVSELFEDKSVGWVIGDVVNYFESSRLEMYVRSETISYQALLDNPDIVRQPGVFLRKSLLEAAGGWDAKLHMVMDFDLWLRLCLLNPPCMLHERAAYFRIHPEQKTRLALLRRQTREIDSVLKRHGASSIKRFRHRTKKECWWVKGLMKSSLVNSGLLRTEPSRVNG